jgi:pyocin large subunit-like protein
MQSSRRVWVLAAVLIALVALLALPRAASHFAPAPAPAGNGVTDSARDASHSAALAPDPGFEPGPRHPEIGFRTSERLNEHFQKHGREFHATTADDYLRLAQTLRDRRKGGDVLEFVRNDAVTCKFDRDSGAFIAYDSDGTIRTFFRPRDGEAYFERQKSRSHEGP